jgi:NADH-quinone oxidoreductase subunit C
MPDAPGLELIAQEINAVEAGTVLETAFEQDRARLIVDAPKVLTALNWLRDTPSQKYTFMSSLHAADYLPGEPRFAIHYELMNRDRIERISVKALLANPPKANGSESLPTLPSCCELYPTAEFQEREVYDFFGIVFDGHPDMRRILMPEDYVGWPQRRDFPVGGEPVIFTRDEPENPGWYE